MKLIDYYRTKSNLNDVSSILYQCERVFGKACLTQINKALRNEYVKTKMFNSIKCIISGQRKYTVIVRTTNNDVIKKILEMDNR